MWQWYKAATFRCKICGRIEKCIINVGSLKFLSTMPCELCGNEDWILENTDSPWMTKASGLWRTRSDELVEDGESIIFKAL